jgi:FkbM family methyltransferase
LREDVGIAGRRAAEAFDRAASPFEKRIVIYGAGELGQKVLAGLRANGLDAVAFADRNPATWSARTGGLAVFSPEDAVQRYGSDSVFVVAVWNPVAAGGLQEVLVWLKEAGCVRVVPFVWIFWKFPGTFLPYYLWDLPSRILQAASDVREAYNLFGGARSQREFLRQLEFRLTGDFSALRPPDGDLQYFPSRLFRPRPDECFIDCGAYDGDTLRGMADWTRGTFRKAVAFEADPKNFAKLGQTVESDERMRGRVDMIEEAVGAEKCIVRFAASGLSSAAIAGSGGIEVQCSTLDEKLADQRPTYIKMDIEGAETDALRGASAVLASDRPTLAICVYHIQNDLWQIPRLIESLMPGCRFVIRPYCINGFELVCYVIPLQGREFDPSMEYSDQ